MIREISFNTIKEDVGRELAGLLQPPEPVDAIFTSNNNVAVACLEYLNENNLRVPQDVAIVSFDDIDLFRFCAPPITAIAQPMKEIGETAFRIMLQAIQESGNGNPKQVVLPVRLVERHSCKSLLINNLQ